MKVFISGIAGFIGSALARELSNDCEIFGIDNLVSGIGENVPETVEWINSDIREYGNFSKHVPASCDVIVHLAAQTSGEKSFYDPLYDLQTNILGTYNIFQHAKHSGAGLIINMSTMSVYGNGDVHDKFGNLVASPKSPYGNSKLAAERLLQCMCERENINCVNLRLFNAYGPGQNLNEMKQGMVSIYLSYLLNSDSIVVKGPPDRVRDLVFIDDITCFLKKIIYEHPELSGTYDLCTGRLTEVSQMLDMLKNISGIQKKIVFEASIPGDIRGFPGNPGPLAAVTGWNTGISVEAGFRKMIDFYI